MNMPEVAAFMELGTKYHVNHLRYEAVSRLQELLPMRLFEFRYPERFAPDLDESVNDTILLTNDYTCLRVEAVPVVINLAWKFHVYSILPAAFYLCAQFPSKLLFRVCFDPNKKMPYRLSDEDLRRCVVGQAKLRRQAITRGGFALESQISPTCEQHDVCEEALASYEKEGLNIETLHEDHNALRATSWTTAADICDDCRRYHEDKIDTAKGAIWESLLQTFDLPPAGSPIDELYPDEDPCKWSVRP